MNQQNEIAANNETLFSGKNNSIEKRAIDIDKESTAFYSPIFIDLP